MPKAPNHITPELAQAVLDARKIQMETGDNSQAAAYLLEQWRTSEDSARKCIEGETFGYEAIFPEGHPLLEEIRVETRLRRRRYVALSKLRPIILERDEGRRQNPSCGKQVTGRDAVLTCIDPEGEILPDNITLLCRRCNTERRSQGQEKSESTQKSFWERVKEKQDNRPDIICQRSGLSIKGRTWEESGCLTPSFCLLDEECDNGEFEKFTRRMDAKIARMSAAQ